MSFFPFNALDSESKLTEVSKIIASTPRGNFWDIAQDIMRAPVTSADREYKKLAYDVVKEIERKAQSCFGLETLVSIDVEVKT